MASRWYVIRTEPQAEYRAAGELGKDGFEIFFPCIKSPAPRPGHSESPLFPSYLFIRWDKDVAGWPTFRPGHRVAGWVKFGDEVPSLPDDVLFELAQQQEEINRDGGVFRRFLPGETVRVTHGNLQGLAAVIEEAKSPKARAKVLLQFMGGLVKADVPWHALAAVDTNPEPPARFPRRTRGRGRWINGVGNRAANTI